MKRNIFGNSSLPGGYDDTNPQNLMSLYQQKAMVDTNAAIVLKNADAFHKSSLEEQKFSNKVQLIQLQSAIDLKRIETYEKKRINRELTTKVLIEADDGKLCFMYENPEGSKSCSKPVLNVSDVRSEVLWAVGSQKKYLRIQWSEGEIFVDFEISAKMLAKKLRQKGVAFKVAQEQLQSLYELFLSYVFNKAVSVEIPRFWGWNQMENGNWKFADEKVLSLEEVEKYV